MGLQQQFPSTEAKDKWRLMTDTALREAVGLIKHGQPALVVASAEDYAALLELKQARPFQTAETFPKNQCLPT